jgi:hypothetical protein
MTLSWQVSFFVNNNLVRHEVCFLHIVCSMACHCHENYCQLYPSRYVLSTLKFIPFLSGDQIESYFLDDENRTPDDHKRACPE